MENDPKQPEAGKAAENAAFRIRDFRDMRRLRKAYLLRNGKPIEVDSTDNPRHDAEEEDFGLNRSTSEEAWQFFCDSMADAEEHGKRVDDLTEFLDD